MDVGCFRGTGFHTESHAHGAPRAKIPGLSVHAEAGAEDNEGGRSGGVVDVPAAALGGHTAARGACERDGAAQRRRGAVVRRADPRVHARGVGTTRRGTSGNTPCVGERRKWWVSGWG